MLKVVSNEARGEASMSAKNGAIKLVAGNSNPVLAKEIANWLDLPLTKAIVRRFADMEIFVEMTARRDRARRFRPSWWPT
jgi:ribose-phosphate pyrophosphokinase